MSFLTEYAMFYFQYRYISSWLQRLLTFLFISLCFIEFIKHIITTFFLCYVTLGYTCELFSGHYAYRYSNICFTFVFLYSFVYFLLCCYLFCSAALPLLLFSSLHSIYAPFFDRAALTFHCHFRHVCRKKRQFVLASDVSFLSINILIYCNLLS